ncbi:MAG: flavodoxin domain-containing protein [Candidatus Methanofastidiosum sp.]|nr:flavodoxin domain-containing protein [Methanofastidiosum sp.]
MRSIMKVCILYDSKYGNGKTCMEYLGSIIKDRKHEVDIYSVKKIKPTSIPESELYIFSAPTHFGDVSEKMKRFIKKIDGKEGKKYSAINTCLAPEKTKENRAIDTIEMMLEEKGMKRATKNLGIKVKDLKGLAEEIMKELG